MLDRRNSILNNMSVLKGSAITVGGAMVPVSTLVATQNLSEHILRVIEINYLRTRPHYVSVFFDSFQAVR